MKSFLFLLALLTSGLVSAQVNSESNYVEGYYKRDGTYVQGHYRTNPNSTVRDNYSTYPNYNPHTGQQGTKYRDSYSVPQYNYEQPTYNYQQPVYQQPVYQQPVYQQPTYEVPTQLYEPVPLPAPTYVDPFYVP